MMVMAIRPWKGPLRKVSLPKPTLSDFFTDDSMKIVKRKKKRPSVAQVPAPVVDHPGMFREVRITRLKRLLGHEGLTEVARCEGGPVSGLSIQRNFSLSGPGLAGQEALAKPVDTSGIDVLACTSVRSCPVT